MRSLYNPLLAATLLLGACAHSRSAPETVHPILKQAQETALYADRVDWAELNREFAAAIEGKEANSDGLKDGLQLLIDTLGDEHAAFRDADSGRIIASYSGPAGTEDNRDAAFINTVINDIEAQFSYGLIENDVGYLKVVGIGPGDVEAQAAVITRGISDLAGKGAKRWILDLRYNGGGNMNPMLAGLAPLLGQGLIGGSINGDGEVLSRYEIRDGLFHDTGRLVTNGTTLPKLPANPKIAVLLSRYTASSGELVAVAFKHQPNTRFIGEPTAGYTTVTGYDRITDDIVMLLSLSTFIDRKGNRYDSRVGVDQYVEFHHDLEGVEDKQMSTALAWFRA